MNKDEHLKHEQHMYEEAMKVEARKEAKSEGIDMIDAEQNIEDRHESVRKGELPLVDQTDLPS